MPATCMTQEPQPATVIKSARRLTTAGDLAGANGSDLAGANGSERAGADGAGADGARAAAATVTGTDSAAAAASAIARLRRRLARMSTLEDPAVRRELRKLDQQLAARLDETDCTPGRHRCDPHSAHRP